MTTIEMAGVKRELLTADDLLRLHSEGVRGELIKGAVRRTTPVGMLHGEVVAALMVALGTHVRAGGLGRVFGSDSGVLLERDPDTVREPDVAFVSAERLPLDVEIAGYCPLAPDLVAEIKSPRDSEREVEEKADIWLAFGVRMALVIDPRQAR